MKPPTHTPGVFALERSHIMDYISLTKPELTFLSVLTALAGFLIGTDGAIQPLLLAAALAGTALVGGGAGSLNQLIERRWDGMMKRTEHRPLPAGRLSPGQVLLFGVVSSMSGLAILGLFVGLLTAGLALLTLCSYLFLYTPLKRITPLATLVGAIPGAIPPVMGWTAAGQHLDLTALFLFAVLFFWQIPHFLSLAWIYRHDYAGAGFRLLTSVDPLGSRTARQSLAFMLLLSAVVFLPWITGFLGVIYVIGSVGISAGFLTTGWRHAVERTNRSARIMFVASLIYLPTLMGLMVVDRLLLPR
ncbi:MAG: heme o synthase [Bacteroidota bacterium]